MSGSRHILCWLLVVMHACVVLTGVKLLCSKLDGGTSVELAVSDCCEATTGAEGSRSDSPAERQPDDRPCPDCTDRILPADPSFRGSTPSTVALGDLLEGTALLPPFLCLQPPSPVVRFASPEADRCTGSGEQVLVALAGIVIRC